MAKVEELEVSVKFVTEGDFHVVTRQELIKAFGLWETDRRLNPDGFEYGEFESVGVRCTDALLHYVEKVRGE